MSLFSSTPVLGLDLGHRTLKGIQLKKRFNKVYFVKSLFHDLSTDNEKFPNNTDLFSALKVSIEVNEFSNYKVNANIGHHLVKYIDLAIPNMSQKELQDVLPAQIQKKINKPLDQFIYDYTIFPHLDKKELLQVKVFYTRSNKIKMIIKMLESSQIKPNNIDSDNLAMIRMLKFNDYLVQDKNYIVVDLGETHSTIILLRGDRLLLANSLNLSLGYLNHTVQMQNKDEELTYNQIEAFKKTLIAKDSKSLDTKQQMLNQLFLEVLQKVQESIDYFQVFLKDRPIEAIYFTGGGSTQEGLCELFKEHYGVSTQVINPLRNIHFSSKDSELFEKIRKHSHFLGIAVGLALKGIVK